MKKFLSILIALALVCSLFHGCEKPEKSFSSYTEICDTESYQKTEISLPVSFFSFTVGEYSNIYTASDGRICKFHDSGVPSLVYEGTEGFSAPSYYNGFIYAVSIDGCLYRFSDKRNYESTITVVSEDLGGFAANSIAVNDSQALITLHTYDSHGLFKLRLKRVNLENGEVSELDLGDDVRLYRSEGGVIYVYSSETVKGSKVYSLYEILEDGESKKICDMTNIGDTPAFVLENGVFYYANNSGDLCALDLTTGDNTICLSDAGIFGFGDHAQIGFSFYKGNIIYYNSNTASIESVYTPECGKGSGRPVKICERRESFTASPDVMKFIDESSFKSVSHMDIDGLNRYSDVMVSHIGLTDDEITLKILAGDSDVDIYFITDTLAAKLLSKNIYSPIKSDRVKSFNESCFDYINEACKAENGDIALMPISNYVYGAVYPESAQEKAGFTREELLYYDGFMNTVANNSTDRYAFQFGDVIYSSLKMQYAKYYCDFDNGRFDLTAETFKKFFTELKTYYPTSESHAPKGFVHPSYIDYKECADLEGLGAGAVYDPKKTLFCLEFYPFHSYATECSDFFDGWRAVPMPRLSENVKANYVSVEFAYINPYSENKEAAEKVLETLADNYMSLRNGQAAYSFLLKDKSAYSKDYHTDSKVFGDFYDIAKDGFIFKYAIASDFDYSSGTVSAEDALKEMQRQTNIWVNE